MKRLSHGRCHPCSVYVGSRIIGAPFNRLSVPHLSECLEKRVYVCDRDGGDGCFLSKGKSFGLRFFHWRGVRDSKLFRLLLSNFFKFSYLKI